MSNVTQNMDDFWQFVMYVIVTQDRKMFSTIKSWFTHTLQYEVIVGFVYKCLLILYALKCSNKSTPLVI